MASFDKFIDDILLKEKARKQRDDEKKNVESPQRAFLKRYRDKTNTKITYIKR